MHMCCLAVCTKKAPQSGALECIDPYHSHKDRHHSFTEFIKRADYPVQTALMLKIPVIITRHARMRVPWVVLLT